MTNEQTQLLALNLKVEELLEELREANKDGSPLRCRELSLAITEIQQGSHWISDRLSQL